MQRTTKQRLVFGALALSLLAGLAHLSEPSALAQAGPELMTQVQANPELLTQGKTLFDTQCTSCHGAEGRGDGLAAAALNPKPRNFHVADGWTNGLSFAGLYKTLEEGLNGGKTGMNAYSHLPAKDRVALIQYVRSLESGIYPEISAAELQQLDQDYDLAKALSDDKKNVPIPVSLAVAKLIEESAGKRQKVEQATAKVMEASSAEAGLFLASSAEPQRALTMLINASPLWKSSLNDFVRLATADLGQNGFAPHVSTYNASQWQSLHNYLKGLL